MNKYVDKSLFYVSQIFSCSEDLDSLRTKLSTENKQQEIIQTMYIACDSVFGNSWKALSERFSKISLISTIFQMEQSDNQEKVEDHILRRYKLIEKVGSGSYGHVWKVVCKKSREIYALKKIFDAFRNVKDSQRTYREISILKKLQNHPNLVHLKEVIRADNDRDIYLVFDYMQCDLFSVIRQNLLKQPHIRFVTYQIAQALSFLHGCQILHRDLKPANILINSDCAIKLCDFGLSRFMSTKTGEELNMTQFVATRWYRSPEIIFGSSQYKTETDLWSFGCILGEMLTGGRSLFSGKTIMDQIERIIAFTGCPTPEEISGLQSTQAPEIFDSGRIKKLPANYWFKDASPEGIDLVYKLLKFNPKQRIPLQQVLTHPFIRDFSGTIPIDLTPQVITCDINDNTRWAVDDYRRLVYRMIDQNGDFCPLIKSPSEKQRCSVPSYKKIRTSIIVEKENEVGGRLLKSSKSDWHSPRKKESIRIYKTKVSLHKSPKLQSPNNSNVDCEKDREKRQTLVAINRNESQKRISVYRKSLKKKA